VKPWIQGSLAAVLMVIGAISFAAEIPAPALRLVDDQGLTLGQKVKVCFSVELRTDCFEILPGTDARIPPGYFSLRIEGENHGPLQHTRQDVETEVTASGRLIVPRKARLQIENKPSLPITLSLYRPDDPTFREPAFRARLSSLETETKIPAGSFIASLSAPGYAPDLQRLTTEPGGQHRLTYQQREGWSMVARIRAASTLKTVPEAEIKLFETVGYGLPEKPLGQSTSGPDGLVLLSGLRSTMIGLEARHPAFLATRAGGLTASPGTFAFREVDLGLGGRAATQVTVFGKPVAGGDCEIHAVTPEANRPEDQFRLVWQDKTDPQGFCRSPRLPQGEYRLRFRNREDAQVNRWVTIEEGVDTHIDLALSPTRVFGEVRRSKKAAAGYWVEAVRFDSSGPRGVIGDADGKAMTDEEGHYELTLWVPGMYAVIVRSAKKVPSPERELIQIDGNGEERVDLELSGSPLQGKVIDEAGRPVAEARVLLHWKGFVLAYTDAQGAFEIELEQEGSGSVYANKTGYRQSEEISVTVAPGSSPPPVTLQLKRKETVRGKILSPNGNPVPGAFLATIQLAPEGPRLFASAQAAPDGEFEIELPPGASRLFYSGPACPLSWIDLPATPNPGPGEARPGLAPQCVPAPAALELALVDETGKPRPNVSVILRSTGTIVPRSVLAHHLQWLGLNSTSDGAGRLILAGLSPGEYELFLSSEASEWTVAAGSQQGFATKVSLPALQTTSLEVTVQ
jgi:protocatechuate 3,4-dioxygenase beta subunit